jgi:hypothetical protein
MQPQEGGQRTARSEHLDLVDHQLEWKWVFQEAIDRV